MAAWKDNFERFNAAKRNATGGSPEKFSADLQKLAQALGLTAIDTARSVGLEAYRILSSDARKEKGGTPVGNPSLWKNPDAAPPGYVGGRARASWQFSQTSPVSVKVESNLPYIVALEFGHSSQAPQGMVRITAARLEGEIKRYLDSLR